MGQRVRTPRMLGPAASAVARAITIRTSATRRIVLGSLFVIGAVGLQASLANPDSAPADSMPRGLPLAQCDPRQPTYNGGLTVDGHQRLAYTFCAYGDNMYVTDTYRDDEGVSVVVNRGERRCSDFNGSNNGVTTCDWDLREGTYLDLCLQWNGLCRATGWATASGFCLPTPAVESLRMQAHAVGGRGKHAKRRFGRRGVLVRGSLLTTEGLPVVGARVCVSTQIDLSDAPFRGDDFVTTDERGQFSYTSPGGPSRRVYLIHQVGDGVVADDALVRVRAPVKLHASPRSLRNGQTVTLAGRLKAGPFPRQPGVLVELQARRGKRWQTFGTTRANGNGRYRFRYRFTRTTGVQRYRLRARVTPQNGYPYAGGTSRPARVTVSG
jgi:hypothetical protein